MALSLTLDGWCEHIVRSAGVLFLRALQTHLYQWLQLSWFSNQRKVNSEAGWMCCKFLIPQKRQRFIISTKSCFTHLYRGNSVSDGGFKDRAFYTPSRLQSSLRRIWTDLTCVLYEQQWEDEQVMSVSLSLLSGAHAGCCEFMPSSPLPLQKLTQAWRVSQMHTIC